MSGKDNLKPVKTTEEAKARGKQGGIRSGEVKREKKLMSQIYGEFLAERFKVSIDGAAKEITGADIVGRVVKSVLDEGGSPAVSLMKEIREATEGSKVTLDGELKTSAAFVFVDPPKKDDADTK